MDRLNEIYELVKDRMSRAEFEAKVTDRSQEFGSLLNREAVATILADELGLLPRSGTASGNGRRAQSAASELADLQGIVENVRATRTFRRPDGTVGFVSEIRLRSSGRATRIVLWDEAVREAQKLRPGVRIAVSGVQLREKVGETEFHSTRTTKFRELEPG